MPVRVRAAAVSASLFSTLGVAPALGRVFTEAEDRDGGPPVAVISHRLWVESFGASPAVVGGPITIDGSVRTLVGVMPKRFDLEEGGVQVTAVYHSHVGAGAYLSELDLRHAQDDLFLFPSADWIVLAVVENRVSEVGLFRRASDGFRGHPVESVLS